MAVASYTTDLTTVHILDDSASPFAVGEPTGSAAGTTIATETDHYVVGTASVSKIFNATGVGGLGFLAGAAVTIPTDGAVYMWTNFLAPNAIDVKANGGMQILVGNTLANYKRFYIYGDDTVPYGGWQVNAVNPAQTASATQGTPNGTWQYFGMAVAVQAAVARGYPLAWDAVRYGRGSIEITAGDLANGYATFDAASIVNDTNTTGAFNRWGIFSYANGTYTLQGRLSLGTAATAVDFRDSNRAIFIKSTEFVTANFNTIEILNAASRVDWTGISISSLSTTSKGRVLVSANADLNVSGCTFNDMDTFSFQSNSSTDSSVFRRCGAITHSGSTFTNNTVEASTAAIAITSAAPNLISGCTFISSGTGHGVEITAANTYNFSGNIFTGYGTADTTNAAVYNNSGGSVVLNITGGGSTPTIRNGVGASTTVNSNVQVTLTGLQNPSEVRVFLQGTTTEVSGTGSENITTGSHSFSISSGTAVDITILSLGYQNTRIKNFSTTADTSVPVSQVLDRQYQNL